MRKRLLCLLLAIVMVMGLLPGSLLTADAAGSKPVTANEAVDEMLWGVNLVDLYIAEPEDDPRRTGSTTGYIDYTTKESYDLTIGIWFWDNSFEWVCSYPTEKQDTIQISIPIPDYDAAIAEANEGWAFFVIRCGGKTGGTDYKITLSDCKITAKDGTILKDTSNFGSNWDGVLTAEGTTSTEADDNGWYWGYGSQENNWTGEIGYYAGEWDASTNTMGHGADPKYNGATFTATLTVDTAKQLPTESKAEYYYCINRTESDYKALVDTYMAEGVNVFRLPVTWTWFVRNDGEYAIDAEWLEMVKETVDYILSKGAYCILNLHNDYLQYSYVAESDGNGGYTNYHWDDQWMQEQYKDYVDARFAAIWNQVANYFMDCSDHLIFEACNEPAMLWYSGVNYDPWIALQEQRVNELNEIFVDTVRATGGGNETRLLCLAVAEYNIHTHLDAITLPEDSDYLMIQIHSYNELENTSNGETWTQATDDLFRDVAAFQAKYPKVPVIVGEVGISHSYQNINNPSAAADKVSYFVEKAESLGVPCLWWEDYFMVPEGGATTIFWIYDKANGVWRTEILNAIKNALNITESDPTVLLTGIEITCQPSKTEYAAGESFDPAGMVVTAVYSDNSTKEITGYTYTPDGALAEDDTVITVSYTEGGLTKTATVRITVYAAELPCDHLDKNSDHKCDLCGDELSQCEDKNSDHKCDICGTELSKCEDKDNNHKCDICGAEMSKCADTNPADHSCDLCGEVLSECVDEDKDYKCDICGAELEKPEDPEQPTEKDEIIRQSGSNRFETATLVADQMKEALGVEKFDAVILANGYNFADALAGSYLSAMKQAPILLTWNGAEKYNYLNDATIAYVKDNLKPGGTVYILGGTSAVPASIDSALSGFTIKRMDGANRFETNLMILEEAGIADGAEVLVCTSTNFADSLSASAAGKPILLVFNESGKLYGKQPEFLAGLKNCTFTVIGGESAVSQKLADAVGAYGTVTRLAGKNRFETSVMVAEKYFPNATSAVLAYAWDFPDGLCGGGLAYAMKAPLILTMTKYEAQAADYIQAQGIKSGVVLGGEKLISEGSVHLIFNLIAED